ncbi:MAG TPA: hypothetical protein VLA09_04705, partial [Longimicrobiales bacterium]|nr:hypothetical protein [Longimicrobiales bacterium]
AVLVGSMGGRYDVVWISADRVWPARVRIMSSGAVMGGSRLFPRLPFGVAAVVLWPVPSWTLPWLPEVVATLPLGRRHR